MSIYSGNIENIKLTSLKQEDYVCAFFGRYSRIKKKKPNELVHCQIRYININQVIGPKKESQLKSANIY